MNEPRERISFTTTALIAAATVAVAAIVMWAIYDGALLLLIGGIAIFGAIVIVLSWVIATRIAIPLINAKTRSNEARYEFLLGLARQGALPATGEYMWRQQIEEPSDMPVSLQGITAEQLLEFKIHAVNLLALSKQEMGNTSSQVIPARRAKENDYFSDVATWSNAVRYLVANKIAYEKYKEGPNGKRKVGTFLMAGTVAQAFDAINQK